MSEESELLTQAENLAEKHQWADVLNSYKEALKINPDNARAYQGLGDAMMAQEQWEDAIAFYEEAIAREPDLFTAYHKQGDALIKLEKWEEAEATFKKALELKPSFHWLHYQLGEALAGQRKWEEAKEAYGRCLEIKADFLYGHQKLGKCLLELHQWEEAKGCFERAIALEPDYHWAHYSLGEALVGQKDWEGAVAAFEKAIEIKPDLMFAHHKLGDALFKLERWAEAVGAYSRVVELNPNFAWGHYKLGDALVELEEWEGAVEAYRQLIQIQPDFSSEVEEKLNRAFEAYQKAVALSPSEKSIALELGGLNNKEIIEIIDSLEKIKPVFNLKYYLENNLDIDLHKVDPLLHYFKQGYKERRNPHPLFDSAYYLERNPDVAAAGINALLHYMNQGYKENRDPSPFFNSSYYLELNPELKEKSINPLTHYIYDNERAIEKYEDTTFTDASPCVVDWRKYKFAKKQLEILKSTKLERVQVEPPVLIDLELKDLKKAAASLKFSYFKQPRVSIVVPVFNQIKYTIECLISVCEYAGSDITYEIIVIDDCSEDETESILKEVENITYLRNAENLGFLLSCNKAAQKTRGEYLLLLNNDVQVTKNWLSPLIEVFEKYANVGLVSPKITYPSGRLQEAGTRINRDGSTQLIGLNDDPNLPRYNYIREVEYCSGVCLLVKTSLFKAVGGFDPIYQPAYYEDADLNFRIRSQGYKIYYQPNSTVIHHLSVSSNALPGSYKMMMTQKNKQIFGERWQEKLEELNTVRLIAFYLPQFHPIKENNRWWGKGFTEWTNVAKARPNYLGHYQPHIPADMGFYDLRLDKIIDEQAELAAKYGIYGFCYYYYWFDGQRLLEMPLNRIIEKNKPDFPFCLAWANENWTRHWNGRDGQILVAQNHSDEDDRNCILDLIRYLRNDNYIRINGKPLLLIYRASLLPDIKRTVEIWRETAWQEGIGEIYLAMVESFDNAEANINPSQYGFQAAVEFPPHNMGVKGVPPGEIINPNFSGYIYDYRQVPMRWMAKEVPGYTRFRGVMPSWDNTPRQQNEGTIFEYASPGIYQAWLEAAVEQTLEQNFGDERIVFINAWNEWAEGTHLEPDLTFGHRWLEATRNAMDSWLLTDN